MVYVCVDPQDVKIRREGVSETICNSGADYFALPKIKLEHHGTAGGFYVPNGFKM